MRIKLGAGLLQKGRGDMNNPSRASQENVTSLCVVFHSSSGSLKILKVFLIPFSLSLQLFQASVQKAPTSVPGWILLQLPGLSVHPQLHEVELRSGTNRERTRRRHVSTFDLKPLQLNWWKRQWERLLTRRKRVYICTWWKLVTSSTWGSFKPSLMCHSSRETSRRMFWELPS